MGEYRNYFPNGERKLYYTNGKQKKGSGDLVKPRRTSGTLKNGNWLRTDTGTDSRVSIEVFVGLRTLQSVR